MPLDSHISLLCSVTLSSELKELATSPILGYGGWDQYMNMDHFVHFTDQEDEALTGKIRDM